MNKIGIIFVEINMNYKYSPMIGKSTIWWTFLAGAATGAVAGLLFAPEKGQKTREVILKRAIDLRKELEKSFKSNDFSYFTKYRKTA